MTTKETQETEAERRWREEAQALRELMSKEEPERRVHFNYPDMEWL